MESLKKCEILNITNCTEDKIALWSIDNNKVLTKMMLEMQV